jgi:hypothetical protein
MPDAQPIIIRESHNLMTLTVSPKISRADAARIIGMMVDIVIDKLEEMKDSDVREHVFNGISMEKR